MRAKVTGSTNGGLEISRLMNSVDQDQMKYLITVCTVSVNWDRPRGYKTCSMLNSAEHEIYPAHKC